MKKWKGAARSCVYHQGWHLQTSGPRGLPIYCVLRRPSPLPHFKPLELRNEGRISDEILHRVEQELDIEAIRLGRGDLRADGAVPLGSNATARMLS